MAKPVKTDDPMAEMRKRYEQADSACADKYAEAQEDIEFGFIPGKQWDKAMSAKRGKRPLYEFNKTRPAVKAVTNDMRQQSPAIKIRAAENSHKDLANIMQGLIRNIESCSRADTAYDTAGFYAVSGGYGVFRIKTEYSNDDAFEQDIRIKEVRNPFAIKFDPNAREFDRRDARYVFVDDSMTREEFKHKYPDADPVDFSQVSQQYGEWFTEKQVRVAEYWCKHYDKKTIYQLSDGRVLDEDDYQAMLPQLGAVQVDPQTGQPQEPLTLKSQRVVEYDRIEMSIVSGKEVLEGPYEWAGKFFPFVPVWGDTVNIEGEEVYSGIIRPIRDAQRLFNWNVCTGQEVLAKQPSAPFMATPAMIEGHEAAWQNLATDNAPALFYNVDPAAPNGGAPFRAQPPTFPGAMFEGAQFAADLMKSIDNVVDAPIQSRASSGKAIQAVQQQGDTGNFDYIDNLARAKAFGGEILCDLIPRIYDTEREIMILGEDGKESYAKLNQSVQNPQTGEWQVINDLSQGKYAVVVSIGPSFATQRMAALEALTNVASNSKDPETATLATYGVIKNMDEPGLAEIEKAMRKKLVAQGALEPGEGEAPPQPPQPDPVMMAEAQLKQAQAQKAMADAHAVMNPQPAAQEDNSLEVAKFQQDSQKAQADNEIAQAQLALDAQTAQQNAALEAEKLRLAWFEAETARLQATQAPEEAAEPSERKSGASQAGESAVQLATAQTLGPALQSLEATLAKFATLAPTLTNLADSAVKANAPKKRAGKMTRSSDGGYEFTVDES